MFVTLTERGILDVLSIHYWKTGLEIVDQGAGARGTIYVHLARLQEMGFVERRRRKGESRFEYRITKSGLCQRTGHGRSLLADVFALES